MIKAANNIEAKTIIVAAVNDTEYDKSKITVISGDNPSKNSSKYDYVYRMYAKSKFIVIPINVRPYKQRYCLAGLTTFVDAVIMHKPVLVSDNTNMGIDVKKLGIGLEYKAGNVEDMRQKMIQLQSLSDEEYYTMCNNMRNYSQTYNYDEFCKDIVAIIKK